MQQVRLSLQHVCGSLQLDWRTFHHVVWPRGEANAGSAARDTAGLIAVRRKPGQCPNLRSINKQLWPQFLGAVLAAGHVDGEICSPWVDMFWVGRIDRGRGGLGFVFKEVRIC